MKQFQKNIIEEINSFGNGFELNFKKEIKYEVQIANKYLHVRCSNCKTFQMNYKNTDSKDIDTFFEYDKNGNIELIPQNKNELNLVFYESRSFNHDTASHS